MVQTWILRSDIAPAEARRIGADRSICGDCRLRNGACYVVLHRGPEAIYAAYHAGAYRSVTDVGLRWARRRVVRIGSYGDPAAAPSRIWFDLAAHALGFTGYTHEWRAARVQPLQRLLMASVETPEDAIEAQAAGWRTYRVRLPGEARLPYESDCPANRDVEDAITCFECGQCDGARPFDVRYSYSTIVHGRGQSKFRSLHLPIVQ